MGTFKKEQFDAILGYASTDDDYKAALYTFESLNDSVPLEDFVKDTWMKLGTNTRDLFKAMALRLEKKQSDFKNLADDYKRLEENVRNRIVDGVRAEFNNHINDTLQAYNIERVNNAGKFDDATAKLTALTIMYDLRSDIIDVLHKDIDDILFNPPF